MKDFFKRLSSRKFIAAVVAFIAILTGAVPPEQVNEVVALATAYIAGEGIGDAAQRYAEQSAKRAESELTQVKIGAGLYPADDLDRGEITSGDDPESEQ